MPSPTVYLHIGAMKTGTSFLQTLMSDNAARLQQDGVLFPGPTWRRQVLAIRDVMQIGLDEEVRRETSGAWERLVHDICSYDGSRAVVSMEFLSYAKRPRASEIISAFRGAEVHVVVTVRDAAAVLPAQWQEATQNRLRASWREFGEAVLAGPEEGGRPYRTAMRALDVPRVLDVWAPLVSPERLHLILVPPSGSPHDLLWRRFASVIGVDHARYSLPQRGANESIGYASATLMRRLNGRLRSIHMTDYDRVVKLVLCKQILAMRTGEPTIGLTPELLTFASEWNASVREALHATGGHIVGALGELTPSPKKLVDSWAEPPVWQILAAAHDAVDGLRRWIDRIRADPAARQGPDVPFTPAESPRDWSRRERPIPAAVDNLEALVREAIALRHPVVGSAEGLHGRGVEPL
jgi:hypothetical protein